MQFISYCRVSTQQQGNTGLGLKAQTNTIYRYISSVEGELIQSFVEVESGRKTKRPELKKAIEIAKKMNACLIVAKLDRLGRQTEHLLRIRKTGIDLKVCDMPEIDKFTFTIIAAVAEREAETIGLRTSAALKAKGYKGQPQYFTQEGRIKGAEAMKTKKETNTNNKQAKAFILSEMGHGTPKKEILQKLIESDYKTSRGKQFTNTIQIDRLLK